MSRYLITPSGRRNLQEENLEEGKSPLNEAPPKMRTDPLKSEALDDLWGHLQNLQNYIPKTKDKLSRELPRTKNAIIGIARDIQKEAKKL